MVGRKVGTEHLVDAGGCRAEALADLATVRALLDSIVARLELRVVGEPMWHAFPAVNGHVGCVTGLYLLTESHLSVHTYPEHGAATINLYCCRPRAPFPWEAELTRALGATRVVVRTVERGDDP
jgi:S-adenosylmethionine decarboxylase